MNGFIGGGCGSFRLCVGLGGNCDCRCGVLYAPVLDIGGGSWFSRDWLV